VNVLLTARAAVLAIVVLLLTAGVLREAAEARPKILLLFDEDKDFTSELAGDVEFHDEQPPSRPNTT
jgi:hypothetical protein